MIERPSIPNPGETGPDDPSVPATPPPAADAPLPLPKPLTSEEQMARYEEQLKEDDWGHQPC